MQDFERDAGGAGENAESEASAHLCQTCKGLKTPQILQHLGFRGCVASTALVTSPRHFPHAAQDSMWGWVTLGLASLKDKSPDCTQGKVKRSCRGCFAQLSKRPLCPGRSCTQDRNVPPVICQRPHMDGKPQTGARSPQVILSGH